jgi:hypothetical protein
MRTKSIERKSVAIFFCKVQKKILTEVQGSRSNRQDSNIASRDVLDQTIHIEGDRISIAVFFCKIQKKRLTRCQEFKVQIQVVVFTDLQVSM